MPVHWVQYAKQEYHGKNTNGNLSFPSKPLPHTMLMVFKEYDFKRLGNFGLLSAGLSGVASPRSRGVGLRSIHSIELPFPTQLQVLFIQNIRKGLPVLPTNCFR